MTTPDYTTRLVMAKLADLEARIAAGEPSGAPAQPAVVRAPGRVTVAFAPDDDPDLIGHAARLRLWLARNAAPTELRAEWQ